MSKLAGNDLMKDMEFLINELHKEWDRSGATKATVIIGIEEATEVNQTLAAKIMEKHTISRHLFLAAVTTVDYDDRFICFIFSWDIPSFEI